MSDPRRYPTSPRLREPSSDVESWSETFDDPDDLGTHAVEILDDEPLFRIAQGYLDGRVTLHLHLRIRAAGDDPDPCEFCAVVASDRGDVLHVKDLRYVFDADDVPRERAKEVAFSIEGIDRGALRHDASDMDVPMLVYVVEPREEGEIVVRRAFSSVVGLDRLDRCPIIRAYSAERHPPLLAIPLPAYVDGELRLSRGTAAAELHELPDEIVKRGPQVVAELPDDEPDTGFGELAAEAYDVLAGLALEVSNDAAIFLAKKDLPFAVERGQVLIRAFEAPVDGF